MHTCPCCGYKTLSEREGWEICPVCFWEDDPLQRSLYDYSGGANRLSLREAQRNFREFGAIERRFTGRVRAPLPDERPDTDFRYLEYSREDAERWGRRLAAYVDELRATMQTYSGDELYADGLLAAQRLLTQCERAYREYKYPKYNTEQFHDLRQPVDEREACEWAQNQLTNWLHFREG